MCSNYEKQLQAIQGQEAETRDQVCVFAATFATRMSTDVKPQMFLGENVCLPGEETAGDATSGQRSAGEDDDGETESGRFSQSGQRGNRCKGLDTVNILLQRYPV